MSCNKCSISSYCTNSLLWGRGSKPVKTKYFVIQDYPTRVDDRFNNTLSGDGQDKFNYFLEKAGIDHKEVFFSSAIKCYAKETSNIKNKHIEACRDYLFKEIADHNPDVIIPMGKVAWQMVSNHQSVREFRGHFDNFELDYEIEVNGREVEKKIRVKMLPTWGLNASLMKWEYNDDIIRDLQKAKKYVETKKIDLTEMPIPNTILTKQGLKDFIEKYREVKFATTDFETTGFSFFKDKIINAGYCSGDTKPEVIYLEPYQKEHMAKYDKKKNQWKPIWDKANIERAREINSFLKYNRNACIEAMRTVNGFDHIKWALHNGKFDLKFAAHNKIPYKRFYYDSLVGDSVIDENLGHSLNIAMERRNINFGPYDTKLWKYTNKDENKKKSYQYIPPLFLEDYLAVDVYGDFLLCKEQFRELKEEGQWDYYFKQRHPALVKKLVPMEFTGVKINKKHLMKISKKIQRKQETLNYKLRELTGIEDFNPNSPKQILDYMHENNYPFDKLKIKETKTGFSTGAKELEKFLHFKKYKDFPKLLLDIKKITKIKGTYIDGKNGKGGMVQYLDKRHRVHANFNCWTPRTSRYSCNRPSLQVWPRPIKGLPNARQAIIPTNKDWCLFEADYSQLEINIVAALSKDVVLIDRLQKGMDLHCVNAADLGRILGTCPDWVKYEHMVVANGKQDDVGLDSYVVKIIEEELLKRKFDFDWKEARTQAKNVGFGLNYGKGHKTFAKEFGISEEEAEDMVAAYFELYCGMKDWRDKIVEQALTKGFITLLNGRKRRFNSAIDWINSEYADRAWSAKMIREEISRQAMNAPVQGGAHDVFEPACLRLISRIKKEKLKARLLLSIHDGIVGECPIHERPAVKQIIEEEMPVTFMKNTKNELTLKIDTDFYEWEWYGKKLKIS